MTGTWMSVEFQMTVPVNIFFKYLMRTYERWSLNISNNVPVASIPDQDEYKPHVASCV